MDHSPAETALFAAYDLAKQELEQQPENDKGACLVLAVINEDMIGRAYGSPEMWARIMVGIAERNENFRLALQVASISLEHGISLD